VTLVTETTNLLIKQYWEKPKANAEIEFRAQTWGTVSDFLAALDPAFDLDTAVGVQLDVLGRIVGISRNIPAAAQEGLPGPQLEDSDYRFFIRVKASFNRSSAYLSSDTFISVQSVILAAFNGGAYVVDNLDMTLTLYVSPQVSIARLRLIRVLGLFPKPQGVRYKLIVQAEPGATFGFSNNPSSRGFSDKFDASRVGGYFARKVL